MLHGVADVSLFTRELANLANRRNAEDAFQLIGIHLNAEASPWAGFRDRFPWLLANVGGGLLAAFVTSRYEALLDATVVLALVHPRGADASGEREHAVVDADAPEPARAEEGAAPRGATALEGDS